MSATNEPILQVSGLTVSFRVEDRWIRAVEDVAFSLYSGRTLALVGESGSGKSVTSLAVMGLLPGPKIARVAGQALLSAATVRDESCPPLLPARRDRGSDRPTMPVAGARGPDKRHAHVGPHGGGPLPVDLLACSESALRRIRGRRVAMIFQEPMTSLNPLMTVGRQIAEVIETHTELRRSSAWNRAVTLMDRVGIVDPARRATDYPHRLSGGMRQRIVIAMALACDPDVLIADEPTTALDVTVQAQILALLKTLQREHGMAMLLITHDISLVAEVADEVAVMYGGRIVETGDVRSTMANPIHPYTQALLACVPKMGDRKERLRIIPGSVPPPLLNPTGCRFEPRCERGAGDATCRTQTPVLKQYAAAQEAACWKAGP